MLFEPQSGRCPHKVQSPRVKFAPFFSKISKNLKPILSRLLCVEVSFKSTNSVGFKISIVAVQTDTQLTTAILSAPYVLSLYEGGVWLPAMITTS